MSWCHGAGSAPADTSDMLAARAQEKAILSRWLKEVQDERRFTQAQPGTPVTPSPSISSSI